MCNKVLDDPPWGLLNIDIAPIHPGVLGLQGSGQEIVPGLGHGFAPRSLDLVRVSHVCILAEVEVKVLLDDRNTVERDLVLPLL